MAMEHKFKISGDWHGEGIKMYTKKSVTIKEGLTILCGCNGCGKTTLLCQIEQLLRREKIPCLTFNNLRDGGSTLTNKLLFVNQIGLAANSLVSSEGEKINQAITVFASQMGALIRKISAKNEDGSEVFFLFDSADSGLSIDNVIELKNDLFHTVITDCRERGIAPYILIAANEYELARGEDQCLDTINLKYRKFPTYDSYRKYIIATRKAKNKRDGLEDWDEFE